MKIIILAAGQGTRLRPYTENKPKALVELWGKPLLTHQLEVLTSSGVSKDDIYIVTGYQQQHIQALGYHTISNPDFGCSNMLTSLFCAESLFSGQDDVVVTYGDVLYSASLMALLKRETPGVLVPGNLNWLELWQQRMENPYDDVESFVFDQQHQLLNIGQKVQDATQVMAQYMGVFKVGAEFCTAFVRHYQDFLAENHSQRLNNLYITDFLHYLAGKSLASTCLYNGGWIEVDSTDDLSFYQQKSASSLGLV